MKNVNLQGFFNDLVRDIRDRRLLLPIVGLLVAIVAVPMLLGGSSESATPPPAAPLDPEIGAEVNPAVLVAEPGVRDYRKRLADLKQTNPFDQKFSEPDPAAAALESVLPDVGDTATSSTGGTDTVTDTTSSSTSASTSSGSTGTVTEPTDTSTDDTSTAPSEPTHEPKPEVRYVVGRVDVSFGPPKDAKIIKDVRELELLPGDKNPIVAFIGLAGNGEHAVFGLTPSVVESHGEGSCSPHKSDGCQFLRLGEGETRYLKTSEGETFKLRLLETDLVGVRPNHDD